jgi:hypothetical protein
MGLSVLITNIFMHTRTGTELFVRDLALELKRQGHRPAIFSKVLGELAEQLKSEDIPITNRLTALPFKPDIIHGHHYLTTMQALLQFPFTPAIFFCHDHLYGMDRPPLHPHVRRYYGVSQVCIERLCRDGVPAAQTAFFPNFVDLKRFQPRGCLPEQPRRALVFSNYAHAGTQLPVIQAACDQAGISLDVVGSQSGNPVSNPESILGQYDLVFAKAKAAMEAMAVGAAVILCDYRGVGPLVTSCEFDALRPLNFGFQALREPLKPENLLRQIARYDAGDAAKVSQMLRSNAGLDSAIADLVEIYRTTIAEHDRTFKAQRPRISWESRFQLFRDELAAGLVSIWRSLNRQHHGKSIRLPGIRTLRAAVRWALFNSKSKLP